jgi:hypothetical protein
MSKQPRYAACVFVPYSHRENIAEGSVILDVSSYAEFPYCTLSPMWNHGGIPIPGMKGENSDSVEGIWQGLKVIRGEIAPRFFRGPGHKRGGKPSGHQYGNRLLKIVEARERIYRVAYEWTLTHRVDPLLLEEILNRAKQGITQTIHDVSDNGDINNPDEGWAHAAVLVAYINRILAQDKRNS